MDLRTHASPKHPSPATANCSGLRGVRQGCSGQLPNATPSWTDPGWQAEQAGCHAVLEQIRLSSSLGSRLIWKDKLGRLQGTPVQVSINRANTRCCGGEGQAGRNQQNPLTPQSKFPFIDKELRARHCQLPPPGITCLPRRRGTQSSFCLHHQSTATAAAENPRSDLLPGSPPAPQRDGLTCLPVAGHGHAKFTRKAQEEHVSPKWHLNPPSGARFLHRQLWVLSWVKARPQCTSKGFPRISPTDEAGSPTALPKLLPAHARTSRLGLLGKQKSHRTEHLRSTLGFTNC